MKSIVDSQATLAMLAGRLNVFTIDSLRDLYGESGFPNVIRSTYQICMVKMPSSESTIEQIDCMFVAMNTEHNNR